MSDFEVTLREDLEAIKEQCRTEGKFDIYIALLKSPLLTDDEKLRVARVWEDLNPNRTRQLTNPATLIVTGQLEASA